MGRGSQVPDDFGAILDTFESESLRKDYLLVLILKVIERKISSGLRSGMTSC